MRNTLLPFDYHYPLQLNPRRTELCSVLRLVGDLSQRYIEDADSVTTRMLFRKVAKGLDEKDFVIAQYELRIKQLEAKVQQLQPRKRRKVQTSPNSKFAGIEDIYKAQIAAGDRQDIPLESDDFPSIASTFLRTGIRELI